MAKLECLKEKFGLSGKRTRGLPDGDHANKIVLIVWLLWFSLLVATPYFLSDPYKGSAGSPVYAYVAVGYLAGIIPPFFLSFRSLLISFGRVAALVAYLGFLLAFLLFGIEMYALIKCIENNIETAYFFQFGSSLLSQRLSLIGMAAAAFVCALSGACLSMREGNLKEARQKRDGSQKSMQGHRLPLFVIPYVLGFVRYEAGVPFHIYVDSSSGVGQIMFQTPCFLLVAPLATQLVISYMLVCVGRSLLSWDDEAEGKNTPLCASAPFALFCLGMLSWNAVTRVVPFLGEGVLGGVVCAPIAQFILLLSLVVLGVVLKGCGRGDSAKANKRVKAKSNEEEFNHDTSDAFRDFGFTQREVTAVELMLKGMSSAESAETMGIKAPTVRSYLQRAYKKAGVENSCELKGKLGLEESKDDNRDASRFDVERGVLHSEERGEDKAAWNFESVCSGAGFFGVAGLFCSVAIPYGASYSAWGTGREFVVGCGLALLLVGVFDLFRWRCGFAALSEEGRSILFSKRTACAFALAVGICGVVVVAFMSVIYAGGGKWSSGLALAFLASSSVLCLGWAVAARNCSGVLRSLKTRGDNRAYTAMVVAFACVLFISMACEEGRFACSILSVALISVSLLSNDVLPNEGSVNAPLEPGGGIVLCWLVVAFFLGVSIEESWRANGAMLGSGPLLFFIGPTLIGCYFYLMVAARMFCLPIVLVVSFVAGIASGDAFRAIVLCLGVCLLLLLFCGLNRNRFRSIFAIYGIVAGGIGLLSGLLFFDTHGDILLLGPSMLAPFGGLDMVKQGLLMGVSALSAASGVAALALFRWLYGEAAASKLLLFENQRMRERFRYCLLGTGLNETQVAVALGIVEGRSSRELSEELNYSRGTVNSARAAVYQTLDVHSRLQLIEEIRKRVAL